MPRWISAKDLEPRLDAVTTVAAVAVIPVMLIEIASTNTLWLQIAWAVNWVIWVVFLIDALTKLRVFGRSWLTSGSGVLGILIVVVSFPGFAPALGGARLARLARVGRAGRLVRFVRLLRVARLGVVGTRVLTGLGRILDPDALPFASIAVTAVVLFGAAAVFFVELEPRGHSMEEALWWAAVTVTTVGYGDIIPETRSGRLVALVVTVIGIAFTSLLTAQLAAYLSTRRHKAEDDSVHQELRELRAAVTRLADRLDEKT